MKIIWPTRLIIFLLLSSFSTAGSEGFPPVNECSSIGLRSYSGWWIRINNNGSGEYGYGTLPARIKIKQGTFEYKELYRDIMVAFKNKPGHAEELYLAASCWTAGSSSSTEYSLSQNQKLLDRLFRKARENELNPKNQLQRSEYDKIHSFWDKNPPIPRSDNHKNTR